MLDLMNFSVNSDFEFLLVSEFCAYKMMIKLIITTAGVMIWKRIGH